MYNHALSQAPRLAPAPADKQREKKIVFHTHELK